MVDTEAYKLMHSRDDDPITKSELSDAVLESDVPPGGPFTLMLPATIKGYGFHNKKWSMYTNIPISTNTKHPRCSNGGSHTGHQME